MKSIVWPPPAFIAIGLARVVVPLFPAIRQVDAGVIVIGPEPAAVLVFRVSVPPVMMSPLEKLFEPLNIKALPPDLVRGPVPTIIPGMVKSLEGRLKVTAPPSVMPRFVLSVVTTALPSAKVVPAFKVS